jgi:hypothetical protein
VSEHAPSCSVLAPPPPKGTWSSAVRLLLIGRDLVKQYRFGDLILAADCEIDGWHFMSLWTHEPMDPVHCIVNLFYSFSYRKIILEIWKIVGALDFLQKHPKFF